MKIFSHITSVLSVLGPSPGTKYYSSIYFPFIGKQNMNLHILSKHDADLNLDGIINLSEKLEYKYNSNDGRIKFKMTESLINTLEKYKCSIFDAWYIDDTPIIYIFVKPIRFKKKIKFKNIGHKS